MDCCEIPSITLTAPERSPITIPCSCVCNFFDGEKNVVPVLVCGKERGKAYVVKNDLVSKWLESVLERPAVLAVQVTNTCADEQDEKTAVTCRTFANEGSLLLVSETSVNDLSETFC